jgi:hypothetical protein
MNAKNYIKNISQNDEHREGPVAKAIEQQTAKIPSDAFLWLAVGSIVASATLQVLGRRETSTFVGQWAPTLLILGLYNKVVKTVGSDRQDSYPDQQSEYPQSRGSGSAFGADHDKSKEQSRGASMRPSGSTSDAYGDGDEGLQHTAAL